MWQQTFACLITILQLSLEESATLFAHSKRSCCINNVICRLGREVVWAACFSRWCLISACTKSFLLHNTVITFVTLQIQILEKGFKYNEIQNYSIPCRADAFFFKLKQILCLTCFIKKTYICHLLTYYITNIYCKDVYSRWNKYRWSFEIVLK